jgi:capsular polysaccharide export protein
MNYVGAYVGSNREFNFFFRLSNPLKSYNLRLLVLSNKLSIIFKCILNNIEYKIIRAAEKHSNSPDLRLCYDILANQTSYEEAEILYASVYNTLLEVNEKLKLTYLFIWNGLSIQTRAVDDFGTKHKIEKRFFELANIPGKLFVDPEGVNAKSSLMRDISILEKYPAEECDFLEWKRNYISGRKHITELPQVSYFRKVQNLLFILDNLGFHAGLPKNGETNFVKKVRYYLKSRLNIIYDEYDLYNGRFIFLPLQVSLDTQLTFNSDIDNLGAVQRGIEEAREENADLLVKIHPAESSNELIKEILTLRMEAGFYLVNYNTYELITNSILLLTINSTVGLEAMIYDKRVKFMGRSFYSYLNRELVKNYIMSYLINLNYFNNEPVTENAIEQILNR